MRGVLLDTNALLWWQAQSPLTLKATDAISEAQASDNVFLCPISVWEIGVAIQKANISRRPDLGGLDPEIWFKAATQNLRAQITPVSVEIAARAAAILSLYGTGDPGDCFLVATAIHLDLRLITRDALMLAFAKAHPDELKALRC